jgi:hypothetical protein
MNIQVRIGEGNNPPVVLDNVPGRKRYRHGLFLEELLDLGVGHNAIQKVRGGLVLAIGREYLLEVIFGDGDRHWDGEHVTILACQFACI